MSVKQSLLYWMSASQASHKTLTHSYTHPRLYFFQSLSSRYTSPFLYKYYESLYLQRAKNIKSISPVTMQYELFAIHTMYPVIASLCNKTHTHYFVHSKHAMNNMELHNVCKQHMYTHTQSCIAQSLRNSL